MERELLSVKEVQMILGVSRNVLWKLIWSGQLPVLRIGRRVLVPKETLEEWITANTREWQAHVAEGQ